MPFEIGAITAKINLDSRGFNRELRKIKDDLRKLRTELPGLFSGFDKLKARFDAWKTSMSDKRWVQAFKVGITKVRGSLRVVVIALRTVKLAFHAIGSVAKKAFKTVTGAIMAPFRLVSSLIGKLMNMQALVMGLVAHQFVSRAQQVETLGLAFDNLTKSIGGTADSMLTKLRRATRGTITDLELFRTTNNAVLLQVVKSEDQFAMLAEAARRLGRAVGRGTTASINDLAIGIGRQSRLILDNLGIIVRADQAYQSYAQSIGKAVSELTDSQRREAFLAATMEAVEKKLKQLGPDMLTLTDIVEQLTARFENLMNVMSGILVGAEFPRRVISMLKAAEPFIIALTAGVAEAIRGITRFVDLLIEKFVAPKGVSGWSERLIQVAGKLIGAIGQMLWTMVSSVIRGILPLILPIVKIVGQQFVDVMRNITGSIVTDYMRDVQRSRMKTSKKSAAGAFTDFQRRQELGGRSAMAVSSLLPDRLNMKGEQKQEDLLIQFVNMLAERGDLDRLESFAQGFAPDFGGELLPSNAGTKRLREFFEGLPQDEAGRESMGRLPPTTFDAFPSSAEERIMREAMDYAKQLLRLRAGQPGVSPGDVRATTFGDDFTTIYGSSPAAVPANWSAEDAAAWEASGEAGQPPWDLEHVRKAVPFENQDPDDPFFRQSASDMERRQKNLREAYDRWNQDFEKGFKRLPAELTPIITEFNKQMAELLGTALGTDEKGMDEIEKNVRDSVVGMKRLVAFALTEEGQKLIKERPLQAQIEQGLSEPMRAILRTVLGGAMKKKDLKEVLDKIDIGGWVDSFKAAIIERVKQDPEQSEGLLSELDIVSPTILEDSLKLIKEGRPEDVQNIATLRLATQEEARVNTLTTAYSLFRKGVEGANTAYKLWIDLTTKKGMDQDELDKELAKATTGMDTMRKAMEDMTGVGPFAAQHAVDKMFERLLANNKLLEKQKAEVLAAKKAWDELTATYYEAEFALKGVGFQIEETSRRMLRDMKFRRSDEGRVRAVPGLGGEAGEIFQFLQGQTDERRNMFGRKFGEEQSMDTQDMDMFMEGTWPQGRTEEDKETGRQAFGPTFKEEGSPFLKTPGDIAATAEQQKAWKANAAATRAYIAEFSQDIEKSPEVQMAQNALKQIGMSDLEFENLQWDQHITRTLAAFSAAGGAKAEVDALEETLEKLRGKIQEVARAAADTAMFEAIGESLSDSVLTGLTEAFSSGEKISDAWAKIASNYYEQNMRKAIDGINKYIGDQFAEWFGGAGAGSVVAGMLTMAAGIIQRLEAQKTQTFDDIEETIDSSEAVRGVVAGPTNVAIATIGDSLKNALITSELLLERIAVGVETSGGIAGLSFTGSDLQTHTTGSTDS